jgi:DNA-binding MarR family transcriptional regulator
VLPCPALWKSYYLTISRAMNVVHERLEAYYQAHNIDLRAIWVLMAAAEEESCSQKVIAEVLNINENMMVNIVDRLEREGKIRRLKNPSDRRQSVLEVTEKGASLVKGVYEHFDKVSAEIFHPIPLKEVERFRKLCLGLLHFHFENPPKV